MLSMSILGGDEHLGPARSKCGRSVGSRSADLFVETGHVETGRAFELAITYDDGTEARVTVAGGRADPNRRMPAALPRASWSATV